MKFIRLRIVWAVAWIVFAILLMMLWVRSHWKLDMISRIDGRGIATTIGSEDGSIYFANFDAVVGYKGTVNSSSPHPWAYKTLKGYELAGGPLIWERDSISLYIKLPHWLIAVAAAMIGAVPWMGKQFSLRTLFLAMTLFAVVMGFLVWMARK